MTATETCSVDAVSCDRPRYEHRKGVLFCPECGHASAVGGDWRLDRTPSRDVVRCPECGTDVDSR